MKNKIILSIAAGCFLFLAAMQQGMAQLKGDKLLGGVGLDAGSQAPAGTFTVLVPLYFYNTSSLKDAGGNKINSSPNLNAFITGVGGTVVTNFKILNATWGATVLLPFAQNMIQGNNVNSESAFAFSDIYVVPVQLGWRTKAADFNFSYGLYIPTGSYELGGDNNSGLGLLTNEFTTGTTIRLNAKGDINFSTLLSYELHSKKRGTDLKTGDIFSVEGGLGKAWYLFNGSKIPSSIIKTGVVYYMQFKATSDQIPVQNTVFSPGKDHVYGAGLEGSILLTKPAMLFGIRWFDEFSAVNRFQGNTFFVTAAHIFRMGGKKE